jgi:formylglycine-generating enzyme required for sulfatase activity
MLQRGTERKPGEITANSLGMEFAWIPPGTFLMGSPGSEEGRLNNEPQQHKITLTKGFFLGIHPVTQEQWQAVMGSNPSHFTRQKSLPVEMVSWEDCQEFIKKLRESDGKPYRLPTEAEWEYACRAGTTTRFSFGETISTDQVNYNGRQGDGRGTRGKNRKKTTPVGSFPANAWGLFDMHGNVLEWCEDYLFGYPINDAVDPRGTESGPHPVRVLRGGCWFDEAESCRSASRLGNDPGVRNDASGLRICFCPD